MKSYTYTEEKLKEIAEELKLYVVRQTSQDHATVVVFEGELGAGKTTCTRALVRAFGSNDVVQSPTFVIMKEYNLPKDAAFKKIIHIDAYRLHSGSEILKLRFQEYLNNPSYLVLIEWGSIIQEVIPSYACRFTFAHTDDPLVRTLVVEE